MSRELRAETLSELNEAFDWLNEAQVDELFKTVTLPHLVRINEQVQKLREKKDNLSEQLDSALNELTSAQNALYDLEEHEK